MSGRDEPQLCDCYWCDDSFTAAGVANHEQYCDDNPHPGISVQQQKELGLLDDETGATDTGTNPHQEADEGAGTLPPRSELGSADKSQRHAISHDGPVENKECPVCDSTDTMDSTDALAEYRAEEDEPLPGAVLAFKLSDRYCNDCFSLWGDEFNEPAPLQEALGIAGGEA